MMPSKPRCSACLASSTISSAEHQGAISHIFIENPPITSVSISHLNAIHLIVDQCAVAGQQVGGHAVKADGRHRPCFLGGSIMSRSSCPANFQVEKPRNNCSCMPIQCICCRHIMIGERVSQTIHVCQHGCHTWRLWPAIPAGLWPVGTIYWNIPVRAGDDGNTGHKATYQS